MKDIHFTKTMIQNYNRVEAIPKLIDGRYYNRNHLVYLYYINLLKNDFSLKDIKKTLDRLNTKDNMLDVHKKILDMQNSALEYRNAYLNNLSNVAENYDGKDILTMLELNNIKKQIF